MEGSPIGCSIQLAGLKGEDMSDGTNPADFATNRSTTVILSALQRPPLTKGGALLIAQILSVDGCSVRSIAGRDRFHGRRA